MTLHPGISLAIIVSIFVPFSLLRFICLLLLRLNPAHQVPRISAQALRISHSRSQLAFLIGVGDYLSNGREKMTQSRSLTAWQRSIFYWRVAMFHSSLTFSFLSFFYGFVFVFSIPLLSTYLSIYSLC